MPIVHANNNAAVANSNNSTTKSPVLIHRGRCTSIYHQLNDNTGYKVIEDPDPTEEQVLQLLAEEHASRALPPCCAHRRVIQVKSFQGNPAIQFQWAPGVSLKDWLENSNNRDVSLKDRLRLAIAIAKTLSDFHTAYVIHGYLSLDNIILDIPNGNEDCVVASLINLSKSRIVPEMPQEEVEDAVFQELQELGRVLNALFTGEIFDYSDNKKEEESILDESISSGPKKRGKSQHPGEGLPLYLTSLISTLILCESLEYEHIETYRTVRDVFHDLQTADRKSDIYLKPSNRGGRLEIPSDAFYGRDSEKFLLIQSFNSVVQVNGQPVLTCVSGPGGVGKTSLINQIKEPLAAANGYFVKGKFDPSARPDSVLIGALNDFFREMLDLDDSQEMDSMKTRIQDTVGSGCRVLMDSIPNLAKFLDEDGDTPSKQSPLALNQWNFLLCKLVNAISHKEHPIVFFVDE